MQNEPQNFNNKRTDSFIPVKKPPTRKFRLTSRFTDLSKKQKVIVCLITAIALGVIGFLLWFFVFRSAPSSDSATNITVPVEEPPKTTEPSRLTGLEVPIENNKRMATGVMIENSPDARPQSGLGSAGVVYEAIAEGGITRFVAIFQDDLPESVGPVRSVRPYYLDFVGPYDASIAHVGGSGEGLSEISSQNIKSLNQFNYPGPYWRERSRYAPHNMYTNLLKLKEIEQQNGWTSTYEGLKRGGKNKPAETPSASNISIRLSSPNYNVDYNYDPSSNTYKRSVGGRPHIDANTNQQLSPQIIIVPVMQRSQNGIYSVYAVNSSGPVFIFQNGEILEGTWSKAGRNEQFQFTGPDGEPLKLASGQTWITIATAIADITHTP